MINEAKVLEVVQSVTDKSAYFFNGTLFLETGDSKIAVDVFNKLWKEITPGIAFGKVDDSETYYDFL